MHSACAHRTHERDASCEASVMRARGNTQEDYLLRIIRQAGEALRRLRLRLAGGADTPEVVRMDAVAATDVLLGSQGPVLALLDPLSAVRMVGHPAVVNVWTALLDLEAGALDAMNDAATASRRRARALALREAAATIWGAADESPADEPPDPVESR
jgi:hypothetical protein